jgi:hypothetical protein
LNSLVAASAVPPAQLYLIAFTGYADADIRDSCLDAGFDVIWSSPEISICWRNCSERPRRA